MRKESEAERLLVNLTQNPDERDDIIAQASLPLLQELHTLLAANAHGFGIKADKKEIPDKASLGRAIITIIDEVLERVTEQDHGINDAQKFFDSTSYEDGRGKGTGSYVVRSPTRENSSAATTPYWQDCVPDSSRTYIPLGNLLRAQGLGLMKEDTDKFRDKITYLLLTADKRFITLDDGHETSADKAFFWASSHPNGIGRKSFYCDEKSGAFLLAEAGIYPTLPKEKAAWTTARVMNDRLGRKSYGHLSQEVQDFLLETSQKKEIYIGDKKVNPAELVGIYRSASHERVSEGGMGYSVYCDPEIEPYLRENLLCNLTPDKKHWNNLGDVLKALHLKLDFTNRYALTEVLKELHNNDHRITYQNAEGATVTCRARQCLGRFGVHGSADTWMVDPDLVEQVITAGAVHERKAAIIADDKQRQVMDAKQEATRRGPRGLTAQTDTPVRDLGQMLEAGGWSDAIALFEQYQAEHGLSHSLMAKSLGITDSTWRIWREREIETTIRPATIEHITSTFGLTGDQSRLLRHLAQGEAEELTPLTALIAETRKQLKATGWQEREKRAQIAGAFFTKLTENYPTQWLATETGVTVNTIRAWHSEIKPEKQALEKAEAIGRNPKLVANPNLAQTVADLLLGLPERQTPLKLLKALEADKLTLGEVLLQKRLENREGTDVCGGRLSTKGEGRNNRTLVSRLEHNGVTHVGIAVAKMIADYVGYTDPGKRYRFICRAMGLRQQQDPDDMMKEFLERDAAFVVPGDKDLLVREYIKKFIDNQQLKTPLFLEMLNAQLPPDRHVTEGGMNYWTDTRPERKLPHGVYRDVINEIMDTIGLKDADNRRLFTERFAIDRPTRGTAKPIRGRWTGDYLGEQTKRSGNIVD
jgi:hypothetical protein